MRNFVGLVLAAGALGFPGAAAATQDEWDVPQPAWEGVWQGKIGNAAVHVCLDRTPYEQKGAYYYDRVKSVLRLVPGKGEGEWFEQEVYDKNGARWQIAPSGGAVAGTWNDAKKQLPVRLSRIAASSKDYEGPCASMAFNLPRAQGSSLTSKPGALNGVRYTKWTFKPGPWLKDEVEVSTFTLDRPGEAVAKINSLLRKDLPKPGGGGEWLECVASNINSSSMDGTFYQMIEPTIVSDHWLGANEHGEYYCGGAHPENSNIPRTFDLVSGVQVDPLDWFSPLAVHREDLGGGYGIYKTLTDAFRKALLKGWKGDEDCDDAVRTQDSWSVGIARGSLVFTPSLPRVIMACGEDFKMPFAKLEPWLNVKGKAALASLPR